MRGPCAKRRVTCAIITSQGRKFVGENDCANPQERCPREPGEGYEKCKSICQQAGHAEVEAVRAAQAAGNANLQGGVAILTGHYWICEPCGSALADMMIGRIIIEGGGR
jgi:deoxycytidylate deaminase